MKLGTRILAFLTVFVMVFGGYAATPAQALGLDLTHDALISLHKTDMSGNPLKDAEYKLEANVGIGWYDTLYRLKTDSSGNASVWFRYAKYVSISVRVVEIDAPNGYILNTDASSSVGLSGANDGKVVSMGTFTNAPKGKITIVKRDAADSSKLLAGAKFDIYKSNTNITNRVANDLTTGSGGSVTSSWLDPRNDYIVVEDEAPDGYVIDTENKTGIVVTSGNVTTVEFTNTAMGRIKVIKHDAEYPATLLEGAHFVVSNSSGIPVDWLVTGSDGSDTSGQLAPGTYTVTETIAPLHYNRNTPYTQTVTVSAGATTSVDFNDTRESYHIWIYKDIEGICPTHKDYSKYTFGFKLTNKDTGEVFTGSLQGQEFCSILVPYGTYLLEEDVMPDGFKFHYFSDMLYSSAITEVNVHTDLKTVYCHNKRVGDILVKKTDKSGKPLVGAKYDIFRNDCGTWKLVGDDVVTGADGTYRLKDQPFGEYKVDEVQAPMGYSNTALDQFGCIDAVGETVSFTFVNTQLFGKLKLAKIVDDAFSTADDPTGFTMHVVGPDNNPNVALQDITVTGVKEGVVMPDILLPFGHYIITESYMFGYNNKSGDQSVTIDSVEGSSVATITNEKLYGDIVVTKAITNGTAYGDTSFTIELLKGGVKVDEHTFSAADANSGTSYTFANKEYGTDYALHEVAPAGYEAAADVSVKLNQPSVSYTFNNTKIYGSITVNKAFEGTVPADGAKFKFELFRDSTKVDEKELTWAAGGAFVKFENLEYGWKYFVKEAPVTGYQIDPAFNGVGKEVVISGDTVNAVLTCTNTMQGKIEITKTDSFNGDPLEGAEFTVTPPTGDPFKLTTAADGKITSGWLVPGNYSVQETKAPTGYAIDDSTAKTVTVTGGATAKIAFTDSMGSILVIKRSSYGDKPLLAGVTFQLLLKDPKGGEPQASDIVGSATTGADGIARFDRLQMGRAYYVRETQQAAGYDIDKTLVKTAMPKVKPTSADAVSFENNPLGTVQVTKTDAADAAKKLAGAVFGIYSDAACTALVQTLAATDANGLAASAALPFGGTNPATYYVKEITAPAGYVLNTAAQPVAFTTAGQVAQLTFTNVRNVGMIIIKKTDALTGAALPGATFALYTDATKATQVGAAVTTGADGIAKFTELKPGSYYLVETVAPTGYILPAEGFTQTVVASAVEPEAISITNQLNPPLDIETGMMDWNVLLIGGLALVAGGLIMYLTRRRKAGMAK